MTRIPIITQNFSSPDGYNDTPLMLLPQTLSLPLSDKDQEGFSQLLLHDLHRHRQSYVRNYTQYETLKKRQDFILRKENLRSLQNFEQRMNVKQDQYMDQTFHSYEQCFVKVINANNATTTKPNQDLPKRPQTAGPSFSKFHNHQLSHTSMTGQEPTIKPFQRYQKTHRPPLTSKYRCQSSIQHSAQSFHDAFQSSSFTNQTQPFLSFTEGYLQKYGDRSMNKFPVQRLNDIINDDDEKHDEENEQIRSLIFEHNAKVNQNKRQYNKTHTPDTQHLRTTVSSRNTNTPSSTPQITYHDALADGLTKIKDEDENDENILLNHEKRRSSQQSTTHTNNSDQRISIKRPKTAKKKHSNGESKSGKRNEPLTTKDVDNDLFKKVVIVQNYGTNNNNDLNQSSTVERIQVPTTTINIPPKRFSNDIRRSSVKSNDSHQDVKRYLDNIDTQMASKKVNAPTPTLILPTPPILTVTPPIPSATPIPAIENLEPLKDQPVTDDNKEQPVAPVTNNVIIDNKQPVQVEEIPSVKAELEVVENRKRVKKSAFDPGDSMGDLIAFELAMMGGKSAMSKSRRSGKEQNKTEGELNIIPENQETIDLLEKIRQSTTTVSIGQLIASQQSCRFELPYDLKVLESLTPLEYLSKYCRLSSRRNYQFKRIFDKYRNSQYRFESNNLFASIVELHRDNFTRTQFDYLCQLIDLGAEQLLFAYDTFSGILALTERIVFFAKKPSNGVDDEESTKDILEKCDFDSLDRKLDGLIVSETMKKLLKTL